MALLVREFRHAAPCNRALMSYHKIGTRKNAAQLGESEISAEAAA